MKTFSKLILLLTVCFFSANNAVSQTSSTETKQPIAYLNFNGEKIGNDKHNIVYKTSFFIKNFTIEENKKQEHINKILNSQKNFSELKLTNVNDSETKEKSVMVILNLTATDIADLNSKIKYLLTELGVENVNYNNKFVSLKEFSF